MQNPLHHPHLPYPFTSFSLASVFDLTGTHQQHHHNQIDGLGGPGGHSKGQMGWSPSVSASPSPTNPQGNFEPSSIPHFLFPNSLFGGRGYGGQGEGYSNGHTTPSQEDAHDSTMSQAASFSNATVAAAAATAYYSYKEKLFKKATGGGKSFTIEALLGLNSAAARAAFQRSSGMVPQTQAHRQRYPPGHGLGMNMNGISLSSAMERNRHQHHPAEDPNNLKCGVEGASRKETSSVRFHPYPVPTSNTNTTSHSHKSKSSSNPSAGNLTASNSGTTGEWPESLFFLFIAY